MDSSPWTFCAEKPSKPIAHIHATVSNLWLFVFSGRPRCPSAYLHAQAVLVQFDARVHRLEHLSRVAVCFFAGVHRLRVPALYVAVLLQVRLQLLHGRRLLSSLAAMSPVWRPGQQNTDARMVTVVGQRRGDTKSETVTKKLMPAFFYLEMVFSK